MSRLLLTFYGDDFTGSTDALEQLTLAGIRAALFIEPPTLAQLKAFPGLQAVGVAGTTRALAPAAMERELVPALKRLKALGARHVHYKVCSTFDSSPGIGSIGRVVDVAVKLFPAPFIPILAAAPALGRYTIFGTHFARYGIGSAGVIYRLDRHPSISKHPVTPMTEADLRVHLAKQTRKGVALFDVLKLALPEKASRAALTELVAEKPGAILFDSLSDEHVTRVGSLIDHYASTRRPLFSIGSSGIEAALAGRLRRKGFSQSLLTSAPTRGKRVLIGSGSCSPVTARQITWALKHGFGGVALDVAGLAHGGTARAEIERAARTAANVLESGRSVIVYTTRGGADKRVAAKFKSNTAQVLGAALGEVLRVAAWRSGVQRICVAGGDTSSFAARALGIQALEMIATLTPGAPLCRAVSRFSEVNGLEVVFKGGQVGVENYFEVVRDGILK